MNTSDGSTKLSKTDNAKRWVQIRPPFFNLPKTYCNKTNVRL
nr:MAG TPA: hypothetical protein [Caudoviricetes sp.]